MTGNMSIKPAQPQTIGEVLDTSFRLYRLSFTQVWPLCLLMALAGSPTTIYMFAKGGVAEVSADNPFAAIAMFQDLSYWMMYLLGAALMLWAMGALYLKQNAIGNAEELSLGQSLQGSLGKLLPLLAMSVLLFIAVMIGMVLLLVPGFILMVSLALGFILVLIEDRGPLQGLTESHRLVWGHWWRTSVILTVALVIIMVLYVAAGFLIGVLAPVFVSKGDPALYGLFSRLLIGVTGSVLVTPYYIALLLAVYWDLKLRKQGGDLAARVGALGAA